MKKLYALTVTLSLLIGIICPTFNLDVNASKVDASSTPSVNAYSLAFNSDVTSGSQSSFNLSSSKNETSKQNIENSDGGFFTTEISDEYVDPKTGRLMQVKSRKDTELLEEYLEELDQEAGNSTKKTIGTCEVANYQVGDTRTFYMDYSISLTIADRQSTIECLYVGEHCTVWTDIGDDVDPSIRLNTEKAEYIANAFDSRWNQFVHLFGNYHEIPEVLNNNAVNYGDADRDNKLAIVCYDIDNEFNETTEDEYWGSYTGGFYSANDNQRSINNKLSSRYLLNYMDVIHIDTFPAMGNSKLTPLDDIDSALSTLFHEAQHLTQRSYFSGIDGGKSLPTYLNEGYSMACEYSIFGSDAISGRYTRFNNTTSGNGYPLTYWNGTVDNYSTAFPFSQYLRTRYAQTPKAIQEGDTTGESFYKTSLEVYRDIFTDYNNDDERVSAMLTSIFGDDLETLIKDYYVALIMKKNSGKHGFNNDEIGTKLNPKTYSSYPANANVRNGACIFYKNYDNNANPKRTDIPNLKYININEISYVNYNGETINIDGDTTKELACDLYDLALPTPPDVPGYSFAGYDVPIDKTYDSNTSARSVYFKNPNEIYNANEPFVPVSNIEDLTYQVIYTYVSPLEGTSPSINNNGYISQASNATSTPPTTSGYYDVTVTATDGVFEISHTFSNVKYKVYSNFVVNTTPYEGTYDKIQHTGNVEITNAPENYTIYYSDFDGDYTSTTIPTFVSPGEYTVYFKICADEYNDYKGTFLVIINPATIAVSAPDLNIKCDGNAHKGEVTVTTPSDGYEIYYSTTEGNYTLTECPSYSEPGEKTIYYKVTADGYNDYFGSFLLNIYTPTIKAQVVDTSFKYDGQPHQGLLTVSDPTENYTINYSYDTPSGEVTTTTNPSFTEIGTYTVRYNVTASYYQELTGFFTVKITKNEPILADANDLVVNYDGRPHSISVNVTRPTSGYTIYYSEIENVFTSTQPLSYTSVGEHHVYYKVVADEYEDFIGDYTITINPADIIASIEDIEVTYDGKAHSGILNVTKPTLDQITVEYSTDDEETFTTNNPSYTKVGEYNVICRLSAPNYNTITKTYKITITNANMDVVAKDVIFFADGYEHTGEVNVVAPADNYTIYYSETGEPYDLTALPKFSEVGEHIVYFKIVADNYNDYIGQFKVTLTDTPLVESIPIYILYNPNSGEHLFTSKRGEYDKLEKVGWKKEGEAFYSYAEKVEDAAAIYRVYNPNVKGGDHHYTKSVGEVNKLVKLGWKKDNGGKPVFYTKGEVIVYKLYNKGNGRHHYTKKKAENDKLVKLGWVGEGIAWYAEK